MGIVSAENHPVQTLDPQIVEDALHQPGTQPTPAVMLIDEHVTEPGEGGAVGDNTGEGRLLLPSVYAVRA